MKIFSILGLTGIAALTAGGGYLFINRESTEDDVYLLTKKTIGTDWESGHSSDEVQEKNYKCKWGSGDSAQEDEGCEFFSIAFNQTYKSVNLADLKTNQKLIKSYSDLTKNSNTPPSTESFNYYLLKTKRQYLNNASSETQVVLASPKDQNSKKPAEITFTSLGSFSSKWEFSKQDSLFIAKLTDVNESGATVTDDSMCVISKKNDDAVSSGKCHIQPATTTPPEKDLTKIDFSSITAPNTAGTSHSTNFSKSNEGSFYLIRYSSTGNKTQLDTQEIKDKFISITIPNSTPQEEGATQTQSQKIKFSLEALLLGDLSTGTAPREAIISVPV